MKNITITTIALLFFVNISQSGEPDKKLHEKCIYPTVMIQRTNTKTPGIGTGVIIKSIKRGDGYINYVFTCAHILIKTPTIVVENKSDEDFNEPPVIIPAKYEYVVGVGEYENWSFVKKIKQYKLHVIYLNRNKKTDIALVTFKTTEKMPVVKINASPKLYIGNEVLRVGCGGGGLFRVDFGKITSLVGSAGKATPAAKNTYRTSIMTIPGDSGGPVFHNNELIGLSQMIYGMPLQSGPFQTNLPLFHMSYVIPIKRFMDCEHITKHLKE